MSSLEPPLRPMPPRPTASDVRRAADALKDAIDAHLFAVETRLGEHDPAVQRAFQDIARAAETYDDLLYQAYDEVTPFEFGEGEEGDFEDRGRAGFGLDPRRAAGDLGVACAATTRSSTRRCCSTPAGAPTARCASWSSADLSEGPPENLPGCALHDVPAGRESTASTTAPTRPDWCPSGGAVWFLARPRAELVDSRHAVRGPRPGRSDLPHPGGARDGGVESRRGVLHAGSPPCGRSRPVLSARHGVGERNRAWTGCRRSSWASSRDSLSSCPSPPARTCGSSPSCRLGATRVRHSRRSSSSAPRQRCSLLLARHPAHRAHVGAVAVPPGPASRPGGAHGLVRHPRHAADRGARPGAQGSRSRPPSAICA